jgi:hypothetical protein
MPDVNQAAAEPSSVNEVITENLEVPAMSTEERATWRMTGKLPDSKPTSEAPASSDTPKEAVSDAAPTKDAAAKPAPATEAGKDAQKPKEEPKTIPYDRFAEVVAEKNDGSGKRKRGPKEAPKEQPKAAKPADYVPLDEAKYYAEHPDATLNDWIQAQVDHRSDWKEEQREVARTKAASEAKVAEEQATIRKNWEERTAAARKDHADFDDVAFAKDLDIPAGSVLDAWVLARPEGAKVLYALGKDRKELARISALDPLSQAAELRDLELKLSGKTPKEQKATAKPVSAAPAPPSSVSATDTAPEDAARAAAEDNDFTSVSRRAES